MYIDIHMCPGVKKYVYVHDNVIIVFYTVARKIKNWRKTTRLAELFHAAAIEFAKRHFPVLIPRTAGVEVRHLLRAFPCL